MNMLKIVARDLLFLVQKNKKIMFSSVPMLPKEEANYLKNIYLKSRLRILEFGSGGSTLFALENGKKIDSFETDRSFYKKLIRQIDSKYNHTQIHYVSIGLVGKYGFPFLSKLRRKSSVYYLAGKYLGSFLGNCKGKSYDVVFIDGRWRALIALKVISMEKFRDALIVIDDVDGREYLSKIENFCSIERVGRLAILQPKESIDICEIDSKIIEEMSDPR